MINGIEIWYNNEVNEDLKQLVGQKMKIGEKEVPIPSLNKYSKLYWVLIRYIPANIKEWEEIINFFEQQLNTPILGIFQETVEGIGKTTNIKIIFNDTTCPTGLFKYGNKDPINYLKVSSLDYEIPIYHRSRKYNQHNQRKKVEIHAEKPPDHQPTIKENTVINTITPTSTSSNNINQNSTMTSHVNNHQNTVQMNKSEIKNEDNEYSKKNITTPRKTTINTPITKKKIERKEETIQSIKKKQINNNEIINNNYTTINNIPTHPTIWEIFYDDTEDINPIIGNNAIIVDSTLTNTNKHKKLLEKQHKLNKEDTQTFDEIIEEYMNSSINEIESTLTNFKNNTNFYKQIISNDTEYELIERILLTQSIKRITVQIQQLNTIPTITKKLAKLIKKNFFTLKHSKLMEKFKLTLLEPTDDHVHHILNITKFELILKLIFQDQIFQIDILKKYLNNRHIKICQFNKETILSDQTIIELATNHNFLYDIEEILLQLPILAESIQIVQQIQKDKIITKEGRLNYHIDYQC